MSRLLPDSYEIDQLFQLTVEDDFSFFAKFEDIIPKDGCRIFVVEDMPSAFKAAEALQQLVNHNILFYGWEMQGGVSLVYDTEKKSYSAAQTMKITKKNI